MADKLFINLDILNTKITELDALIQLTTANKVGISPCTASKGETFAQIANIGASIENIETHMIDLMQATRNALQATANGFVESDQLYSGEGEL
ncbi:hypothetical protein HCC18_13075 [Listeria booriae]|uniref:hypothetical protein n=1 Tax=Listeria booriae TaxID=1552123 RepID=UPI0016272082|nr:hypothetical protein [Listeria booriae]MBC2317772.1 hypothetical protein [Listeria booriae]